MSGKRPARQWSTWAILLVVCAAVPCFAQTTAVIQGRVFDASTAVVPGATATLRDSSTGFSATTLSALDGRDTLAAIPAGTYTLSI
ncbi:MAG TPA: carboxypeptidase-like regulatory domain-containing protein [Vicinamibacterales bacterium]|nr:carboxypeptidase-like regulatory domain-containing protein [Vicinamibacterales bacterium]